ncbi:MAG: cysteine desulfurase [Candidatus Micrarchaeota archaeon]|nr:cysteine desulfurase [Candidatus Micrarchaeota archaeon]
MAKNVNNNYNYKSDFPILNQKIRGKPLVYLDSASTSQKPANVIASEKEFYEHYNANIHRGVHYLSEKATQMYEDAREKTAKFVEAKSEEIVFVRGATEGINLIAATFGEQNVKSGDTILITEMEHHSNLVPWQQLAARKKAKLEFVEINTDGTLNLNDAAAKLEKQPAIFSFTHVSNVLGTINPVEKLTKMAKKRGVSVVLDAAQSAPHLPLNFATIGADFAAFSGHKMLSPTGIGAVYGKREHLENMPPYQTGGHMIKTVTKQTATWNDVPWKFEAGTSNIAGAVGLGAAIEYLEKIGMKKVERYNAELVSYCLEELQKLPFVTIYGPLENRCGVVSFNVGDMHSHDVSSILDEEGIAIRSGHHCCQPLMETLGVTATCRASFHIYNTMEDVDKLVNGLKKCKKVFKL